VFVCCLGFAVEQSSETLSARGVKRKAEESIESLEKSDVGNNPNLLV
jgi:hypothetical protein